LVHVKEVVRIHGAATRVAVSDTAFPHRAEGYNFIVISEWMERANTDRSIAWARQSYAQMEPFFASGARRRLGHEPVADANRAAATLGGWLHADDADAI
jgi:hypothetical protein